MNQKKKAGRYERVYKQLISILEPHNNPISAMATIASILHNKFDYFFWTGFYLLDETGELRVGPYQGPVACILLKKDVGVCWAGINKKETIVVPDVHNFPGHIACDSRSSSEIVVPLKNSKNEIVGVMDVDSKDLNSFDKVDKEGLERILTMIYK